ncbi:hypothetical protein Hanom_Chr00s000005g01611431 [Helianthus anomalus]
MHDDMRLLMNGMGEMYKYMGISVLPHPPQGVYPDGGPFYTQQLDPSMLTSCLILSPTFPCSIFLSPTRPCRFFLCPTFPFRYTILFFFHFL